MERDPGCRRLPECFGNRRRNRRPLQARRLFLPRRAFNQHFWLGGPFARRPWAIDKQFAEWLQKTVVAPVSKAPSYLVGVISDTHGMIRPEALQQLRKSDMIVHCGDVGAPAVLDALRAIAPVHAVRGNNDKGSWASHLPTEDIIEVRNHTLYVIHDLAELSLEPSAAGFAAVLSGHSHRPLVERRKGVLFVNPGSAGPRRFSLPVAVALLVLRPDSCNCRIIKLVP